MTIDPAPPDGKEWTQVTTTPKRGSQKDKKNEQRQMNIETTKWRAEFVVNRSDRGKQWLIDVAVTNLLRPFFQQDSETKIVCDDNTVITNPEEIKKEINRKLSNVAKTTETNARKIVVFNIHFPPGLMWAKRNRNLMTHLKECKVFLNEHTCESLTLAQVGFLIHLDPNTAFRPDVVDRIQAALTQHLMTNPNDGKSAFDEPTNKAPNVPFFELRKGIEIAQYKPEEDNPTKISVKTEVLQVWTETQQAEKLRSLMSKADLEQKSVGQFIPKQRGIPLFSIEKYVNAINSQNKYISETSTIMIQCVAPEAMSAGIKTAIPNAPVKALDEHILSIDHVKRIEQTNDTEPKGKWLIVCDKSERENIREILTQHICEVYMRSTVYDNVKDMFYSPVPIVAPPRYNYETYVERIIPESMLLNQDTIPTYKPKSSMKHLPMTITTTAHYTEKTRSSPYLEAAKRSTKRGEKSTDNDTSHDMLESKSTTTSIGLNGAGSRSNDSALSALTSKVDSLTSKLTAVTKEFEAVKQIIIELRQDNTELKNMYNKTEAMFQQMMMNHHQLLQSINPILIQYQNNQNSGHVTNTNTNAARIHETPIYQNTTTSTSDNTNFLSARTSFSTTIGNPRPIREPPDIRPTNLLERINENNPSREVSDGSSSVRSRSILSVYTTPN